ncbi:MAG: hypothetical protein AB7V18_19430 [Pyrinomonadaceae bacterium]
MTFDRGAKTHARARRMWQSFASGEAGFSFDAPLSYDEDAGGVSLTLGNGLTTSSSALTIDLRDTDPALEVVASGLGVLLNGTTPCLSTTGGLTVVVDTSFGLSRNASGVRIDLASNSGLEFSSGDLQLDASFIQVSGSTDMAFFGATPISQPGAFAIANAPTASDNLDADANGGVYTGIDNAQAGTVYAAVADLNDLRADVESVAAVLRQLIRHLGDDNGLGLVAETGY